MSLNESNLGRSLNDVLAKTVRREPPRGYLDVEIGIIVPSSKNPRTHFAEADLKELADSIATHGVLQPIVVIRKEVGYEIVSGERRYRAAKMAGLTRIPVVVRDEDNPQHLAELRLIENLQRADLNPIEVGEALQALITEHGLTHDELAGRVNKDRSSITNVLRLLHLPAPLRTAIAEGRLSAGHAKVLAGISDPALQLGLARKVEEDGLSVRALEQLARLGPAALVGPAANKASKPAHLSELESNLKLLFGTPVQVKDKGGKGSITLQFHDRDHFNRVVAIMDRFIKQSNLRNSE